MSRTFKTTTIALAAAVTFAAFAPQSQAQTAPSETDIMAALVRGMSADSGSSSEIRRQIETRMQELLSEMNGATTGGVAGGAEPVTIDEIDRINRSAERERTALEFEQTRFQRMQLEIERLLALYEVVKTLEDDARSTNAQRQQAVARATEGSADGNSGGAPANFEQDQSLLPRIDSISGMAGVFTAEAEFEDATFKTLKMGDQTMNGFVVEEISSAHVVLRGPMSGNLFRLSPKAPPPPAPENGPGFPGNVIDLSNVPMAQF